MKIKIFQLESIIETPFMGVKGMLTHAYLNADGSLRYLLQPEGLDKDGAPKSKLFIDSSEIPAATPTKEMEYPDNILLSEVTDTASGFKGVAKRICWHLDGCVHVCVQPKGTKENGDLIDEQEFDLRRLKGKFVPKRETIKTPSPASTIGSHGRSR